MKPNLPVSRNRNLPPPPSGAAPVMRRRSMLPPEEPRRGPSVLRSLFAMLLVGGLLGGGIWAYIHSGENDVAVRDQIELTLQAIGQDLWMTSSSASLSTETAEAAADFADLPRVIAGVRAAAKGAPPEIRVIEGDPLPGNGSASHQIVFYIRDRPMLVVRVWMERDSGFFKFFGVHNRAVPERKELNDPAAAGGTSLPPSPAPGTPSGALPPLPDPAGSVPPPPVSPPPFPEPAEKVSEQP